MKDTHRMTLASLGFESATRKGGWYSFLMCKLQCTNESWVNSQLRVLVVLYSTLVVPNPPSRSNTHDVQLQVNSPTRSPSPCQLVQVPLAVSKGLGATLALNNTCSAEITRFEEQQVQVGLRVSVHGLI